jgi:membrane carboxypeptidase/penicillin-binding protein
VWLAAYGPKFVIVTWLGNDDFSPLHKGAAGGQTVAPIVRRILDRADGAIEFSDFMLPAGATTIRVDRASGSFDPEGDVVEIIREDEVDTYTAQPDPEEEVPDVEQSAEQPTEQRDGLTVHEEFHGIPGEEGERGGDGPVFEQ